MYYPIVKVQLYGDDDKFSIKDLVSFFKVEWTIVDENSKEVKKENLAHFEKYPNEPGHFVPECTYNKDTHATLKVEAVEKEKVEEDEAIVKKYDGYASFAKKMGDGKVLLQFKNHITLSNRSINEGDIGKEFKASTGDMYKIKSVYDLYDGMLGGKYKDRTGYHLHKYGYLDIGAEDVSTRECFYLQYDPEEGTFLRDIDSDVEVLSDANQVECVVRDDADIVLCDNVKMKGSDFNKLDWGDDWEFSDYKGNSVCIYNGMYGSVKIKDGEIVAFSQKWVE